MIRLSKGNGKIHLEIIIQDNHNHHISSLPTSQVTRMMFCRKAKQDND